MGDHNGSMVVKSKYKFYECNIAVEISSFLFFKSVSYATSADDQQRPLTSVTLEEQ